MGATLHIANLPGGEALSPDEPLIFENAYPFARLLAQGDALVKGSRHWRSCQQNHRIF